jgi:ribosome-associated toxin RatA of RatAB toxin-antitoxin module
VKPKKDFKARAILLWLLLFATLNLGTLQGIAKTDATLQVSVSSVPKSSTKNVQGRILVEAPPAIVWQILTDYPGWVNRVPGYEQSRILKSTAVGKILDVTMKVNTLLPPCRYQVQTQEKKHAYQLLFQRVSGDFDEMTAIYNLSPLNNGRQTILSYTLNIDVGVPLPGLTGILKNNAEKSLNALKRYSELEAARSAIGQR